MTPQEEGLLVHAESPQARDFYLHLIPEFEQSPPPRLTPKRDSGEHLGARWGRGRTSNDANSRVMTKDVERSKTHVGQGTSGDSPVRPGISRNGPNGLENR